MSDDSIQIFDDAELEARRAALPPQTALYETSFTALYQRHVSQAPEGCDFRFLENDGSSTPDPEIH